MRGDFHTHSTLDDGKSSLEEMAAAAWAAGLTHFGFSGHSYCPLEEDYCIPREKIPEYLARARAVQARYAGEMEVFVGLELDLLGERPEGLDYAIGSVHTICGGDGRHFAVDESSETAWQCVEELFGGDWYHYTDAYYDQVALLPERTGCDWIGHFDLVTKFNERAPAFDEESPRYLRRALEVMEHLVRSGTALSLIHISLSREKTSVRPAGVWRGDHPELRFPPYLPPVPRLPGSGGAGAGGGLYPYQPVDPGRPAAGGAE